MHNDNNNEFSLLQIVTTLARANSKVLELRKIITFSNKRASYSNNSFKLLRWQELLFKENDTKHLRETI